MELAAKEQRAEHGNEGDCNDGRGEHRKRLSERQRMKQLALLSGQGKHRHEGQQDDGHREEDGPAHETRGFEHGLPHASPISWVDLSLLKVPKGILRDDNAGIDEHANSDRDARQAHDVRGDAGVIHAKEGDEHRERERDRHDQNRADVHQEDDVRQCNERDLLEERMTQGVNGLFDQM